MYDKCIKRIIDIILAILMILLSWPIYLVVALLVRIKLGKPIIFKQLRPGKEERIFYVFKFRTMKIIKDEHGNDYPDNDRKTIFGEKLRHTSFDKLPELWNILKGDMSFVGPRPTQLKNYVFFTDEIKAKRQKVRPGLFSVVKKGSGVSWDEAINNDIEYASKVTFLKDLKILTRSICYSFTKLFKKPHYEIASIEDYGVYLLNSNRINEEQYKHTLVHSYMIIGLRKNKDAWPK